jgi:hypothetical protein
LAWKKMTPEDVAQSIVSTWESPRGSQVGPEAERKLAAYWQEVRTVFAIKAWRSVMALTGQLIEALVKHCLLDRGYKPHQVDKKTLGHLLELATQAGILPPGKSGAAPTAILSAALVLRNWASHYSAWAREPDAYQSAQALTLLVASSESLYPTTAPIVTDPQRPRPADPFSEWESVGPAILISALEDLQPESSLPTILVESPTSITDRFTLYGSARTLVRLEAFLRSRSLPTDSLRASVAQYFLPVVRNASHSSFRSLVDLLLVFRRIGLETHSNVMGILLPADPEFLAELVANRAPAYVACYLSECFRANKAALSSRIGNPKKRAIFVKAFWNEFGAGVGNIINAANILAKLPPYARIELLRNAPVGSLTSWIASSDPRNSVNLLTSVSPPVIAAAPDLAQLRDEIVSAIADSVKQAPLSSLQQLPLRLRRLKATDAERGAVILREVLARTVGTNAWQDVRRILWDTYSFCPDLETEAIGVAKSILLSRHTGDIPAWERLCIVGMLEVCSSGPSQSSPGFTADDFNNIFAKSQDKIDRWQLFLAVAGLASLTEEGPQQRPPSEFLDRVEGLLGDTEEGGGEAAIQLLSKARAGVGILRRRL